MPSALEQQFLWLLDSLGGDRLDGFVREWRFHRPRRWRFDFAWVEARVAVELEGGTFCRGRHVRPTGFAADCEKYNAAALDGWKVLRYTAADLKARPVQIVEEITRALEAA